MTEKISLIPPLQSNNDQGFVVSCTSDNTPPYGAFDGSLSRGYRSNIIPRFPEYLTITFPKEYTIDSYRVYLDHSKYWGMREWEFQGLVDGEWITLNKGMCLTHDFVTLYFEFEPASVSGVRIKCLSVAGANSWGIVELEVYEYKPKVLIKSSNKILTLSVEGTWIDTGLTEPLAKEDFDIYGLEGISVITKTQFEQINSPFEVLLWTNKTKVPQLELTIPPAKPYRLLDNPSIVTYTEDEEIPILSQTVLASTKVRFLVSKDKINYQIYRNGKWITVDKDNIFEQGMTKLELESIPQEAWAEWVENEAHKHSFDILIGMYSESPGTPIIRSITVNYAENESPIVINAYIEPDTIHNEFATLKAHVKDYEGDRISFKVLIKKAGTDEFVQVSPLEGWYNRNASETEITQAFNFPYFNPGENEVKLVVKDERGAEAEWTGRIILSNTDPTITIAYDDFSMRATIGDDDNDMVAYRISINGELIFDYTDFMPSKAFVDYVFDTSKLKFGEENTITIEAKDTHGGYAKEEFTVIGSYRGLMFKNENGEYFVDDKGEILMDLLFGKTLIGGQTSETKKVILENRHEFPITNVQITPENPNFTTGAMLEISETEMPFTPKDIIKVLEVMPSLGEKDFYVRVKTTREAHQGGYFYIKSTATPVLE